MQNIKEETSARTEKLRRQSEKEGRNPAEKFLSDIFTGFKQKTEDVSQSMTESGATQPATDILETDEAITIISDIPGLKKYNIELGITQTSVEITATYKEEPTIVNANFIQKERGYGVVHRTLNLPSPINIGKATANYKNCILTINLPKEEKDLTKIKIQE